MVIEESRTGTLHSAHGSILDAGQRAPFAPFSRFALSRTLMNGRAFASDRVFRRGLAVVTADLPPPSTRRMDPMPLI